MTNVLLTGTTGQAASYMADLLVSKGYKVYGIVRRSSTPNYWRIQHLLDSGQLTLIEADLHDQSSLMKSIEASDPELVFNLGAQSHVGISWGQAVLTVETTGVGALRMIESVRLINPKIKFYQASSSELFGNAPPPQDEKTPFYPRSPYGYSKLLAHFAAINARESYGMFVVCGINFNFESPRRGIEFVTRKISNSVARIKHGLDHELHLGNLDALRDWTHAKSTVEAMYLMMQQEAPKDYVVGSGTAHSVREFCELAFSHVGLNYQDYVKLDEKFLRKAEVNHLCADPRKIKEELGWRPLHTFEDLVKEMVDADMERVSKLV